MHPNGCFGQYEIVKDEIEKGVEPQYRDWNFDIGFDFDLIKQKNDVKNGEQNAKTCRWKFWRKKMINKEVENAFGLIEKQNSAGQC